MELVHQDDRRRFRETIDAHVKAEQDWDMEYRFECAKRGLRYVHCSGFFVKDAATDLVQVWGIVQDITARKEAEISLRQSEERYRALFDQSAESIVLVDTETMRFTECNEKAYRTLGYERKEFLALTVQDVGFDVQSSVDEMMSRAAVLQSQGELIGETRHRHRNGKLLDVSVKLRLLRFAGKPGVLCVWRDITEEKRKQEIIANFKEEVERRERERLAGTLHDTILQNLQIIVLNLKRLKQQFQDGTDFLPESFRSKCG